MFNTQPVYQACDCFKMSQPQRQQLEAYPILNKIEEGAETIQRILNTAAHINSHAEKKVNFDHATVKECVDIVTALQRSKNTLNPISYEDIISSFPHSRNDIDIEESGSFASLEAYYPENDSTDQVFDVRSEKEALLKGHQLFDAMMMLRGRIDTLKANWVTGVNIDFMREHAQWGMPENQIKALAKQTWTGRQAARYGFTEVSSFQMVENRHGTFNMYVDFKRP